MSKPRQMGVTGMFTYKAMYKYIDEGVHAEVPDFPAVITWEKG